MKNLCLAALAVGLLLVCSGELRADLTGLDIGGPNPAGSTVIDVPGSDYTSNGAGGDIWDNNDHFQYAYDSVTGDFTAIVRVVSMKDISNDPPQTHDWAKAGIMARTDLDDNSVHTSVFRAYSNGTSFQYRTSKGGGSGDQGHGNAGSYNKDTDPVWMKLDRKGNVFAAQYALDSGGTPGAWQNPKYLYSAMPDTVNLGLATTSHNNDGNHLLQAVYKSYSVGPLTDYTPPPALLVPAGAPMGGMGTMGIREVVDNGDMNDQGNAYASLNSGSGNIYDYSAPVLNILDSGGNGHFGDDARFGVVAASMYGKTYGNVDHIALVAQGTIHVPTAGAYTFGVNSDDGFTLLLHGQDFSGVNNGELAPFASGVAMRYWGGRGASDTLGTVNLPAGDIPFALTFHEGGGGAAVELFAAEGAKTSFDGDFRLVGHKRQDYATPGMKGNFTVSATVPGQYTQSNLQAAKDALALGPLNTISYPVVNFNDPPDGPGMFGGDAPFPGDTEDEPDDHYALRATGQLEILEAGKYQLGFQSDDGASLRIAGRNWDRIVDTADWGIAAINGDTLLFDAPTGNSYTLGEITLDPGLYDLDLTMFEIGGGSYVELFGRSALGGGLELLSAGGARIVIDHDGLQLVPEPATWVMLVGMALLGLIGWVRRRRVA